MSFHSLALVCVALSFDTVAFAKTKPAPRNGFRLSICSSLFAYVTTASTASTSPANVSAAAARRWRSAFDKLPDCRTDCMSHSSANRQLNVLRRMKRKNFEHSCSLIHDWITMIPSSFRPNFFGGDDKSGKLARSERDPQDGCSAHSNCSFFALNRTKMIKQFCIRSKIVIWLRNYRKHRHIRAPLSGANFSSWRNKTQRWKFSMNETLAAVISSLAMRVSRRAADENAEWIRKSGFSLITSYGACSRNASLAVAAIDYLLCRGGQARSHSDQTR